MASLGMINMMRVQSFPQSQEEPRHALLRAASAETADQVIRFFQFSKANFRHSEQHIWYGHRGLDIGAVEAGHQHVRYCLHGEVNIVLKYHY